MNRIFCTNALRVGGEPRLAYHRKNAAALAREIRAMWPDLKGGWTRRDWNQQALAAARNHVSRGLYLDRVNK